MKLMPNEVIRNIMSNQNKDANRKKWNETTKKKKFFKNKYFRLQFCWSLLNYRMCFHRPIAEGTGLVDLAQ